MLREMSLWARLPLLLGLSALIYLTYCILSPFLIPVAWAAILAFVTWPLRTRLLSLLGGRTNLTAALMTLLLATTLIGPLAWLLVILQGEVIPVTATEIGTAVLITQLYGSCTAELAADAVAGGVIQPGIVGRRRQTTAAIIGTDQVAIRVFRGPQQ